MSWRDDLSFRFRALGQRRSKEQELSEELRLHLELEVERRMAAGASREEAERASRLAFGGAESIKEQCRDAWGIRLLEETARDLRGALRLLWKEKRFAVVAIASVAIGMGAATVIFSVVDAVLLRPLPFEDPERVVALREVTPEGDLFSTSDPNLLDFEARSQSLEAVAALRFPRPRPALHRNGEQVRLSGMAVTPSFFRVLGVWALFGRTFDVEDARARSAAAVRAPRVVVLAYETWQSRFGGDEQLVGQKITLDGEPWTVLGILPPGFRFGGDVPDLYLPYLPDADLPRDDHRLETVARLAPRVNLEEARSELRTIALLLSREYPKSNAGWSVELMPIERFFLGAQARRANVVLLGAAGLLLLLACVNVSNLLLARGNERAAEIRLRLALGASRRRLLSQLLTESAVLGILGSAVGLVLALCTVPIIRRLDVPLPRLDAMSVDLRALGFSMAVALGCGLLFGIAPALRATATPMADTLRTKPRGSDRQGSRLRATLVGLEVALATVLAVGAGLLLRSFGALSAVDTGFDSGGVLLAQIDLPADRYPESSEASIRFYSELIERVETLPGVDSASASIVSPFRGPAPSNTVAHKRAAERRHFVPVQWRCVTADYFRTLRIPILRGRSFEEREGAMSVVISEQLAGRLWPRQDPIGQEMRWSSPDGPLFEVVGVVGEVRDLELGDRPQPTVYLPQSLVGWPTMTLAVRSESTPETLVGPLRRTVQEIDPLLANPPFSTLAARRRSALAQPLLSLRLMAVFAVIAVLLAAIGLYGIVAYSVNRRRGELGLRAALGARPAQLARSVVLQSIAIVSGGLLVGLVGALGLVGTLRALLYQTSPFDPRVLVAVALLLLAVSTLASWTPARRAARLDPAAVLREE